jgi:hypothetical protein
LCEERDEEEGNSLKAAPQSGGKWWPMTALRRWEGAELASMRAVSVFAKGKIEKKRKA